MRSLKKFREEMGMSQLDISDKLGFTSPQFISNIERGAARLPAKLISKIACILSQEPRKRREIAEAFIRELLKIEESRIRKEMGELS